MEFDNEFLKMTSYRGDVPPLHLNPDELRDLAEVMTRDCSSCSVNIRVGDGGYNHSFDSVDEFLEEPSIPDFVRDYEMEVKCEQGSCTISWDCEGFAPFSNMWIRGDDAWVKAKKADMERFFKKEGILWRKLTAKMWYFFPICIALTLAIYFLLTKLELLESNQEWIILIFFLIWVSDLFLLDYIVPHSMIVRDPSKHFRPLLRKILGALLGLLTIGASVITIGDFVLL